MEGETRAYLDGKWTMAPHSGTIYGPDGDPILVCNCRNAAHFLTPRDVAEYLMEIHEEYRVIHGVTSRERNIGAEPAA